MGSLSDRMIWVASLDAALIAAPFFYLLDGPSPVGVAV